MDFVLEELHANHGKYVVNHLKEAEMIVFFHYECRESSVAPTLNMDETILQLFLWLAAHLHTLTNKSALQSMRGARLKAPMKCSQRVFLSHCSGFMAVMMHCISIQ